MIILLLLSLFSNTSFAADDEGDGQKVVYKTKTEIDFDDLEVEGVLQKPQSALVLERKKAYFNPLIKIRTDWDQEISESVDEVK